MLQQCISCINKEKAKKRKKGLTNRHNDRIATIATIR